ncbi:hypothetical protein HAX54_003902 [Datura stramonium]|uniref:Uncharacterized protein n=1 Tax=Datura stramonium TaxID=4076 RepID=A0ABS8T647_DATST|nr:hypothetical protein [Datura stramonium]
MDSNKLHRANVAIAEKFKLTIMKQEYQGAIRICQCVENMENNIGDHPPYQMGLLDFTLSVVTTMILNGKVKYQDDGVRRFEFLDDPICAEVDAGFEYCEIYVDGTAANPTRDCCDSLLALNIRVKYEDYGAKVRDWCLRENSC